MARHQGNAGSGRVVAPDRAFVSAATAKHYRGCPQIRCLSADPPWKFDDRLQQGARGAEHKYGCLSVQDICRYPLPPLADDAMLALWRVSAMEEEALRVAWSWGFKRKAEMVWVKLSKGSPTPPLGQLPVHLPTSLEVLGDVPDSAKLHYGMGRTNRSCHEVCLIATRGRFRVDDATLRSVFFAPVQGHSVKPEVFYEYIERLCPDGPRAELFARRRRRGWRCYGNQLR